ncbi:uncharacterized protein K452DRAFT_289097 [Aplosporella prunicola CBS 121167]|uniref:Uncharacterized protein n=1 Tax=Aplosporella prunicola CBS 121167 TaxID=1176127 RepID=A0A6A6B883_9PEZI|nr:uncharacterized protein K452DRAFT_289097 [Aplosporella prunicola CBS 121167]KAF2140359.1 hypothetical protein K452DRAFT_289097 [Aplosporella prunicola CBS 121167]
MRNASAITPLHNHNPALNPTHAPWRSIQPISVELKPPSSKHAGPAHGMEPTPQSPGPGAIKQRNAAATAWPAGLPY